MKPAYFDGSMFMLHNTDENNYLEETELDTNPSSNPKPVNWWT